MNSHLSELGTRCSYFFSPDGSDWPWKAVAISRVGSDSNCSTMSWRMRVLLGAIFKWNGLKLIISSVILPLKPAWMVGAVRLDYDADSGKGTAAFHPCGEFRIPLEMNPFAGDCEHVPGVFTEGPEDH